MIDLVGALVVLASCSGTAAAAAAVAISSAHGQAPAGPGTAAEAPGTTRPRACDAASFRAFDFLIGDWTVVDAAGKRLGTNRIEAIEDGCALLERWTGAKGGTGTSLTFLDAADGAWHQAWMSRGGQALRLRGGPRAGAMVLEGETRGPDGRALRNRITWTPLDGGRVRQHWETSHDGRTWTAVFDGFYERAPR